MAKTAALVSKNVHLRAAASDSAPAKPDSAEDAGADGNNLTADQLTWVACLRILLIKEEYCMLSTATGAGVSITLDVRAHRE